MSDAAPSTGSSGIGFFLGFFAIIAFLAITMDGKKGVFSESGTTTPSFFETPDTRDSEVEELTYTSGRGDTSLKPLTPPLREPVLTPQQIEDKVAQIYRELDNLRDEMREAKLREPVSPYAKMVDLSIGNVRETNPDHEYLTLSAQSNNTEALNISHWYLESYVTDERAVFTDGDRLMTSWRSPASENIVLAPGERAYLVTGESPIGTSFHENICTGYLNDVETFYPPLGERCPRPLDEMERFGKIKLDNDNCYTLMRQIATCSMPTDERIDETNVSGVCLRFVENTFNYNDCVALHRYDPYFERDGYWRIYLDERNELWRPEREIIRLMDAEDRVIDVIEY